MGNLCPKKKHEEPLVPSEKIPKPENNHSKISENDFTKIKLIGKGSYGNVFLVRYNKNNMIYAMKVYKKSDLREKNQENNTKSERNLLTQINFPFIVEVKFAFQTDSKLFLVQEFIQGGDLFFHIHSGQKFSTQKTKFYLVEIILAIDFLHKNNMIYRDLKPENILIDSKGHIKLTDFGLSKIVTNIEEKSFTICGTLQYIAPEIISGEGYNESVDWWSLGIIMYEMLTGKLPFKFNFDNQEEQNDLNIYDKKIKFPSWIEENAKDLINKLLNKDPEKRIGSGKEGAENIKKHPFFSDIDWNKALNKELRPPFIPKIENETDIKYFEKSLVESPVFSDSSLQLVYNTEENEDEDDYDGFTFVATSYKELKDMGKDEKDDI
jgi:serine/threonine protein kinase